MASLLRQLVASPRVRHPEADLDLCYVTDTLIATSGPSSTYPQIAYRNPTAALVNFLDTKHGANWAIWEFRAEGTGYPDEEVYGRVWHYPWPDHHPPPFALIPLIMGSMRKWLKGEGAEGLGRVVVVHCKAGKGRSGTVSCSYLISEEGWTAEAAMQRFTERRMRPGFGAGISIPSQLRTVRYVDRWTRHGKVYVERAAEVVELHVWGLRDGVKIAVEGYVEEGKVIKNFHTFKSAEREIVRGAIRKESGLADAAMEVMGKNKKRNHTILAEKSPNTMDPSQSEKVAAAANEGPDPQRTSSRTGSELAEGGDVVFRPSTRVVLPSSDINIDFERRNRSNLGGFTMVTSVAHVWFNTFFEGNGPEQSGRADESGVFEIAWEAMDGIKGSARKGTRAFDRMAVVWKAIGVVDRRESSGVVMHEPGRGEEVRQMQGANWAQSDERSEDFQKKLGLRTAMAESAGVSRASSVKMAGVRDGASTNGNGNGDGNGNGGDEDESDVPEEIEGVKQHLPGVHDVDPQTSSSSFSMPSGVEQPSQQLDGAASEGATSGIQPLSTAADLPGGRAGTAGGGDA
ncbi:hypothetical protein LTR36_004114 [Oleoguttula mirabilis]|uniref:phosphatidylinositol-3,4,5-trisphosphate 3-phosphatase n=1 Tax=Oleoguttula mirabilis TaxID=1507867 RepID=A0AAV9JGQ7_9PEZI|nr:hypothetical protein LTR36_004114 [Oleoguttula mirabilis]